MVARPISNAFHAVITHVEVPPGRLGPDPVSIEVRCFIVPRADGVVLVDVGPPSTGKKIEAALGRIGATWSDVSDIVLTHAHFDHVGGLAEVAEHAPQAVVCAGAADLSEIRLAGRALKPLAEGDRVRGMVVLETPGHTPGHLSLLDETDPLILVGDAVGNVGDALSFGPPAFTADQAQARVSLRAPRRARCRALRLLARGRGERPGCGDRPPPWFVRIGFPFQMSGNEGMRSQGSHEHRELRRADLDPDPINQFLRWFDDAEAAGIALPNAMALATTGADGQPTVRHVLLREADQRGFVFYTNHGSRKGRQLEQNPRAAIVFLWKVLDRQVCATGGVRRVDDEEADAYFATRPREAQIGAWASAQSSVLRDRAELEERVEEVAARFRDAPIPRPPHWGGYRLTPDAVEFWQGRPFRLHDRFMYTRDADQRTGWRVERLSP